MGSAATILYRRERKDMPAIDEEIQAAEEEGSPHRVARDHRLAQIHQANDLLMQPGRPGHEPRQQDHRQDDRGSAAGNGAPLSHLPAERSRPWRARQRRCSPVRPE